MNKKEILLLIGIIGTLVISRLMPHAPNFTSSLAGFIFAGAILRKSYFAIFILIGYYICDLLINNLIYPDLHSGFAWTSQSFLWIYSSFLISFLISKYLTKQLESPFQLLSAGIITTIIFFILSNFGVWTEGLMYSKDFSGLITCYIAALPFALNELAASVFFTSVFFFLYWKADSYFDIKNPSLSSN